MDTKLPPIGPPQTPQERARKAKKRRNIIWGSVIGVAVVLFASYKLYFKEYFAYQKGMDGFWWDAMEYLHAYPDGRYVEEMNIRLEEGLFQEAQSDYESSGEVEAWDQYFDRIDSGAHYEEARKLLEQASYLEMTQNIDAWFEGSEETKSPLLLINDFAQEFPKSTFQSASDSLYRVVWDRLNETFDEKVRTQRDKTGGIAFFRNCMNFLEENQKDTIFVHFTNWDSQLKDWEDYSTKAKDYLDEITELSNEYGMDLFSVKSPAPSTDPPPSAKPYVQGDYRLSNKNNFVSRLNKNFTRIFGNAPFDIVLADDDDYMEGNVRFDVDVRITNQDFREEGATIPELYTITTSTDFVNRKFDGYIFGIEGRCQVRGRIPQIDKEFQGTFTGDPASSFSNIDGLSDAYEKLMGSIFSSMGQQFGEQLGFPAE